jgi:hypothetical protein
MQYCQSTIWLHTEFTTFVLLILDAIIFGFMPKRLEADGCYSQIEPCGRLGTLEDNLFGLGSHVGLELLDRHVVHSVSHVDDVKSLLTSFNVNLKLECLGLAEEATLPGSSSSTTRAFSSVRQQRDMIATQVLKALLTYNLKEARTLTLNDSCLIPYCVVRNGSFDRALSLLTQIGVEDGVTGTAFEKQVHCACVDKLPK